MQKYLKGCILLHSNFYDYNVQNMHTFKLYVRWYLNLIHDSTRAVRNITLNKGEMPDD